MSGGGQRTLFQSWGSRVSRAPGPPSGPRQEAAPRPAPCPGGGVRRQRPRPGPEEEAAAAADDDLLLAAADEAERGSGGGFCAAPPAGGGFCAAAGSLWIYPTNWPERGYQVRMARAALLANTLVCLPTGLGKTFIAAVVMYNFYRWFPSAKVLFLAPTKPLVAQQMEACARVMGIPQHHMAEMTGGTQVHNRKEIWHNKRVFFLTPQVMVNDLSRGTCPAAEIKCLVIDEAHKALGNYAYCQVVKELSKYTNQFRILALSATPGSDTKAVQEVISNLLISQIELCSEDSPDIQPYSHERQVEKFVVPLGKELAEIQNAYIRVLETFAGRLIKIRVLAQRDIPSLTKYQIILARDQFRKNPSSHNAGIQQGIIEGDFALCISLYHGYELLLQMGTRSLFIFLCGIMDGSKGLTRARNELSRNEDFMKLYRQLETMFSDMSVTSANGNLLYNNRTGPTNKNKIIYSHPKLKKLEEVVVEHFKSWKGCTDQSISESKPSDTRVMIFSSFRDSVQEIAEMLSQHHPIVRVMTFVGHSTGKSMKGFTQKEQLEVVKCFREGGYNTLVSTCVGEEGLDIGEVDLIICFDAQKSPIRLVQRMGRTGRKRKGRIVVILAEGREQRTYNQSQSNKKSIYKAISENKMLHFYQQSPRLIPEGINPKLHKMFITPAVYEPNNSRSLSKERRSSSLQHKSALFSMGTSTKQTDSRENWFLTSEEFEVWNSLYKLKESDGVKEPMLSQSHFETLENMEEIAASRVEGTCELSLSEWRLWQNRPFPTYLVDHSDRCYHFISVMEMIELMRHEEGDCSYELEIQPYLNMDDVKTSNAQRSKCLSTSNSKAQKAFSSRKNVARGSKVKLGSYSLSELDTECISLFKTTNFKTTKRTSALNLKVPAPCTEVNILDSFSTAEDPVSECTVHKSLPDDNRENVTFHLNELTVPSDLSGNVTSCANEIVKECQSVNQACSSLDRNCADSGYSSFTEEKSPVSCSLFYLPEAALDSFALTAPAEDPSLIKILKNVKRLLSQSPPPLNKLHDCEGLERTREHEIQQPVPFQKVISNTFTEGLQGKTSVSFTEFQNPSLPPQKCSELNVSSKLCSSISNCHSEPSFLSEAFVGKTNNGLSWDDIFDCDNGEHTEIQKDNLTMVDHALTNSPSDKNSVDGYKEDSEKFQENMATDQDESINLFEDEHFSDANNASLSKYNCNKLLMSSDLCDKDAPSAGQISEGHISDECFLDSDANPKESLISYRTRTLKISENMDIVSKQFLDNEDLYDCSQELFPVNFDLGFSIQESEDEQTDMNSSSIQNSDGIFGTHVDVKPTSGENELSNDNLRHPSPPKLKDESIARTNFSTPLSSQNQRTNRVKLTENCIQIISPMKLTEEKEHGSYNSLASAFSTPKGRKVMNVKVLKRIPMNAFSRVRQEIPQMLPTNKVNTNTVKVLLNSAFDTPDLPSGKTENLDHKQLHVSQKFPIEVGSSSESEEEIVFQRKNKKKENVLKSPDVKNNSDFESPVHAVKKRRHPLNTSDLSSDEGMDFHKKSNRTVDCDMSRNRKQLKGVKRQKSDDNFMLKSAARQFLDEEAELSLQEAEDISSDESDSENELNSSLNQFLNDETQFTEVLNDSEMEGVYLKSVRSPALGNRYKMVHKGFNSIAVFSQIPEQDEAYLADSFCVEEEEEESLRKSDSSEEEEACVNFDPVMDERSASGRKQYFTRRRVKLNQAKTEQNCAVPLTKKRSRIIVLDDSSGDETNVSNQRPVKTASPRTDYSHAHLPKSLLSDSPGQHNTPAGKNPILQPKENKGQRLINLKTSVSEVLDFQTENRGRGRLPSLAIASDDSERGDVDFQAKLKVEGSSKNHCANTSDTWCSASKGNSAAATPISTGLLERKASLCILVDSREISSGSEIISSLKAVHGVKVQVCSLGGCDYIVSNRMAVERRTQSELLNSMNRNKVTQRIQHLQSMFERICVIVEKDRIKAGETSRLFQRTKYYDALLSALIRAGIRILFSSCQEESAHLLKDLALVEQRKNVAICVPTEVKGAKEAALRFYLSIPNISYLAALNMCHGFDSVRKMVNSSPKDIATGAQVSQQKAEEIYRYIHSGFDLQMLPEKLHTKGKSNT